MRGKQRALPRADGFENREKPVVELWRGERERRERHRRRAAGAQRAALCAPLLHRGELMGGRSQLARPPPSLQDAQAHPNRQPPSRREPSRRASTARARSPPRLCCAPFAARVDAPSRNHGDVRRKNEQPHEERHRPWKRHPPRAAERRRADGDEQTGCADRQRKPDEHVHAAKARTFAFH